MLWAGYGASVAIQIAIYVVISPLVSNAVSQALYLAWSRVSRGEIPPPSVLTGMPTAPPSGPAPPINPQ